MSHLDKSIENSLEVVIRTCTFTAEGPQKSVPMSEMYLDYHHEISLD